MAGCVTGETCARVRLETKTTKTHARSLGCSLFLILYSLLLFTPPYSSLSSLFLLILLTPPYSSFFLLLPSSYLLSVKPPYNSDMKRVSCSENVNFVR